MASSAGYTTQGLGFPHASPNGIVPTPEHVAFDPAKHLQLEAPAYVKMLHPGPDGSERVLFPIPACGDGKAAAAAATSHTTQQPVEFTGLAYTAPFRVMNDEGVKAIRQVIAQNEKFAEALPSRCPKSIRGIGYRSSFMRDFTYSPQVLGHLAQCCGKAMHPHDMQTNIAQINFGKIGSGEAVDQWHLDSVPYVMVLLLSDATDMEGGTLQVARFGDPLRAMDILLNEGGLPADLIDTVNYPGPGHAIFMQGSRIAHSVTSVKRAREPRLTLVNSYQTLNPFEEDRTILSTFTETDGEAANFEFARHVAWRVKGQMDHLMNEANYFGKDGDTVAALDRAAKELERARDMVSGKIRDRKPYATDEEKADKNLSKL